MAKKMAFLVNCDRCIACNACEVSCKNYYQQEASVHWRKVYYMQEKELALPIRVGVSLACNHCEDPACMKACPTGAYRKREDGIVVHDNDRCIGCKLCMMACPYKVPCFDKDLGKVTKCDMCAARQDNGEQPVCVQSCPMDAISIIDLNDGRNPAMEDEIPGMPPRSITRPTTRFIRETAGTQIRRDD